MSRREFRLTENEDALLVEAASLSGMSVSEFILEHAVSEAEAVVRSHHTIELAPDAYRSFVEALDQAATTPNPAFASLVSRARPLKHAD
jgi:uncharacterized protein (DUF1778 family)